VGSGCGRCRDCAAELLSDVQADAPALSAAGA
jgi:bacterioferritin-associated ferredoxin